MLPRVFRPEQARSRFGALLDALVPWLEREDPLADAVVRADHRRGRACWPELDDEIRYGPQRGTGDELRALLDDARTPPRWLDERRLTRGGDALFRAGPLGGLVLGAKSLVCGYAAPAGNKPLALTGQLEVRAPRRLSETARFVEAVCLPGSLRQRAEGTLIALKVRLIHARVRFLCSRSPAWRRDLWGAPVNQHDMLSTILLFSHVLLEGLSQLGVETPDDQAEDYLHLWSYVGHLLGVDRAWLPLDRRFAKILWELVSATQGPPDDDSRALVRALLKAPITQSIAGSAEDNAAPQIALAEGLCRGLIGDALADELGVPRHALRHLVRAVAPLPGPLSALSRLPAGELVARDVGRRYWRRLVREGLRDEPAQFTPPRALAGSALP